jgi:hypothetical protein
MVGLTKSRMVELNDYSLFMNYSFYGSIALCWTLAAFSVSKFIPSW